ncbi:MAG TPA: hypothetical protein VF058_08635 [Actinomycetota bacterium]
MLSIDRLVWTATRTLEVGSLWIGVRVSSDDVERAVAAAFGPYLVEGLEPVPNFSVRFEDATDEQGVRYFQILYRGDCQVVRTMHRSRVIRALRSSVARFAGEGSGLFRLRQVVLVSSGRAMLIPPDLLPRVEEIEADLRERGIEVLDPAFAHLDPATGEVVVPERVIPLDEDTLRALDADGDRPPLPPGAEGARLPVAHWAVIRRDREEALTRMDVFAALMPSIEEEADVPIADAMRAVAGALSTASVGTIYHQKGEELLRTLGGLPGAG